MTALDSKLETAPAETDTLIVGGGMAGLYSAWRLTCAGRKVRIVEQLDRTGGRLQTDHVEIGGVSVQAEEGGMRFMNTQRELLSLFDQLGLSQEIIPFPMGGDDNLYYLRGKRFTFGQAQADPAIWSRIYHLDKGSMEKQPGQVLWDIRNVILQMNGQNPATWESSPANWTDFRLRYTYKEIPLYQWGFWALLEDYGLSQDCIEMLYSSSGFIAPYDQQINAGCAFQLVADFINPKFLALRSGYSMLPRALEGKLRADNVPIHLQHQVQSIDRLDDGRLRVVARCRDQDVVFLCRTLILAVTQLALQRLAPFAPILRDNAQFMADVETVADMPLGKINLYYTENWWTPSLGIRYGPCFTDLPLAQVYFFEQGDGSNPSNGPSHITIYTDYYRSNFWAELQGLSYPVVEPHNNPPHTVAASRFVMTAVTRQMKEMFGLDNLPDPVLSTYKVWIDPRMGDGDHQWLTNIEDSNVRERLSRPVPNVHVCGESYSDDQAWVNGALRSVDYMLAAHFGL